MRALVVVFGRSHFGDKNVMMSCVTLRGRLDWLKPQGLRKWDDSIE